MAKPRHGPLFMSRRVVGETEAPTLVVIPTPERSEKGGIRCSFVIPTPDRRDEGGMLFPVAPRKSLAFLSNRYTATPFPQPSTAHLCDGQPLLRISNLPNWDYAQAPHQKPRYRGKNGAAPASAQVAKREEISSDFRKGRGFCPSRPAARVKSSVCKILLASPLFPRLYADVVISSAPNSYEAKILARSHKKNVARALISISKFRSSKSR